MDGTKQWWQSSGIWGALISLIATIANGFGFHMTSIDQQQATQNMMLIASSIGAMLALIGRLKASSKIAPKPQKVVIQHPDGTQVAAAQGNQAGFIQFRLLAGLAIAGAIFIALGGCSMFGMATPKTPAQQLAVADEQFSGVVESLAELRDAGVLTPAQIGKINPWIKQGNTALDNAWAALHQGQPASALNYLPLINQMLFKLRDELHKAQAAKQSMRKFDNPTGGITQWAPKKPSTWASNFSISQPMLFSPACARINLSPGHRPKIATSPPTRLPRSGPIARKPWITGTVPPDIGHFATAA